VRNLNLDGILDVEVLDSKEAKLKSGRTWAENVVLQFPSLRPDTYYVMIRSDSAVPYELLVTAQ
jgi:hypothetical protein